MTVLFGRTKAEDDELMPNEEKYQEGCLNINQQYSIQPYR